MIIVSITGPTLKEALRQVAASERYADAFEFRLDLIEDSPVTRLLRSTAKPAIATCRPRWEGGAYEGPERERFGILLGAADAGARYVDVELKALERFRRYCGGPRSPSRLIVSLHLKSSAGAKPAALFNALDRTGADVVKLAYGATDAADLSLARDFLWRASRARRKAIAIAMGEAGEASRVLYRKFGGWGTYAAPESGAPSAPGQIRGSELKRLFRADRLNRATRVFGVVGWPVSQSKGIYLHNALFRSRNAVYCRFPVKDLPRFLAEISPFLRGFSVTLPHKRGILGHLDTVDGPARAIGAVNTVLRRGRRLRGTNSDGAGALDAIERVVSVRGATMLILGAGGAARAIAYEGRRRGARVIIASRRASRGKDVARDLGVTAVSWSRIQAAEPDIVVNATPVGMSPRTGRTPVSSGSLKATVVFDAIYTPRETRFLREARRRGARAISGVEMFLNQAAIQSCLYTGRRPDRRVMKRMIARYL